jgi:rhodanese-related sulfurtransferase
VSGRPLSDLLKAAALRVERLSPERALEEASSGALVVDIRSCDARRRDGIVPGSLHLPMTVLHWRLEPGGPWRSPHVAERQRVIVLCDHGSSSLLAAALVNELGVDAADVEGGFAAWRERGLPVRPCADPPLAPGELQGMRAPEPP